MSAETDLLYCVNRAANALGDARIACRTGSAGPVPRHHRGLLLAAVRDIQRAEEKIWRAGQDPWQQTPSARQLSLELAA